MTHASRPGPYVLVAGAWLGGWAWDDVAGRLRRRGREVRTHTLAGLAEREGEATPALDVAAHIDDLASLLEAEELRDVMLVGHSYAGAVVTGAAAVAPERVARLVYVDAEVPRDDRPLIAGAPSEVQETMRAFADDLDGWRLPLVPDEMLTAPEMYGAGDLTAQQLATFRERATPFPLACMTAPLPPGTAAGAAGIPRTFVRCTMAGDAPWWADPSAREPADSYVELRSGHWPMWSQPQRLSNVLLAPVRARPSGIDRYEPVWSGAERPQLDAMLDFHRDAVVRKLDGLSSEQARRSPVASGTSLLGLVWHLADVEYGWASQCFAGIDKAVEDLAGLALGLPTEDDDAFDVPATAEVGDVLAAYRRACELSRARTRDADLDELAAHPHAKPTLRWVLLHLIEETARHAGHADVLRELLDATVGE